MGHPLAIGLVAAYVPAAPTRYLPNAAGGPAFSRLTANGTPTWATSPGGVGLYTVNGANNYLAGTGAALASGNSCTIAWYGVPFAFVAGSPYISMLWGGESGASPFLRLGDGGNAQKVQFVRDAKKIMGATDQTAYAPLLAVGVSSTANFRVYTNGRLDGSTTADSNTAHSFTPNFGGGYTSGRVLTGVHLAGYAWARPLTSSEVAWLYAEPYAFFTPPGPRVLYFADFGPVITNVAITAAATLPALTAAATLVETIPLAAAATLPALTAAATLTETIPATGAATLPALTASATVTLTIPVAGTATLPALTAAATITVANPVAITAAATLPALTAAATITVTNPSAPGTITGTFAPTGAITATFAHTGTTTGVFGP